MRGDPGVLELLNDVLTGELTAVNQYFVHAMMQDNWGYERLHERTRNESIDEMKHAESLVERILYLEGVPNLQRLGSLRIGENVQEQFELDLGLEREALQRLNDGVAKCVAAGDDGSRELLASILQSEEVHVGWLETQLEAIRQVGLENYLGHQLRA